MTTNALATPRRLFALQSITLVWMLIECAVSLFSSARNSSPSLLAFGLDSFVELLSAALVILAVAPFLNLKPKTIDRAAASLLYALAAVVALVSALSFAGKVEPGASPLGIAVTFAALLVMPLLASQKRKLARLTGNNSLAADAIQSATCAYLAAITLAGLILNAAFHLRWADSLAALAAIPILIVEARRTLRGQSCGCGCAGR